MKQIIRNLLRMLAISMLLLASVGNSYAQLNSNAADCNELKDPDVMFQMDLCKAHAGCRLVMGIHNTCVSAKKFFTNLKEQVGEGVKSLFGYKKEVTSDMVFEASLSDRQRALEKNDSWREKIEPVRNALSQIKGSVKINNDEMVSSGNLNSSGFIEGEGIRFLNGNNYLIISKIAGLRADYVGTKFDRIDLVNDTRHVGTNIDFGKSVGNILYKNGGEYRGEMAIINGFDRRQGQGFLIEPGGRQMEGRFTNDLLTEGVMRRRDGTLIAKGKWDETGILSEGQLFDETGIHVTKTIDVLGDQKKAAAAKEAEAISAFRNTINAMNAGQLFAKADELSNSGDSAKAREVFRALVSRFPDHPLAATAAQQMSKLTEAAVPRPANNTSNDNSGGGRSTNFASNVSGRPFEECLSNEKKNTAMDAKLLAIPKNDTVKLLRGGHFASRWLVENYSQCLPDPRAKEQVDGFRKTMAETMQTCKQLSSNPSICEVSPF